MTLSFAERSDHDAPPHSLKIKAPAGNDWLQILAAEYKDLRSCCVIPLSDISIDGLDKISVDQLKARMHKATIPARKKGPLDIVRSDLGEMLLYNVLESSGTKLGYKSVRDREIVQLPGRGIDAFGVEPGRDGRVLALVLGEAKVSAEAAHPPQVVDKGDDCLRQQHLDHIKKRKETVSKLFDQSRHVLDADLRNNLLAAALLLEEQDYTRLEVIMCSVLVRPESLASPQDFGSFAKKGDDFLPGQIRFVTVVVPDPLDELLDRWHRMASGGAAA